MRRIPFAVASALALVGTSAFAQQKRAIVPEDLYHLKTASDVAVSPDGRWVVYVQTAIDSAKNRYVRDLYAATSDGAEKRRLTWTPEANEASPVFSPDGRSLAFLARREGDERAAEIYILPFTAPGEARRVTTLARGTSRPVWSPDGTRLAFTTADSVKADTTKPKNPTRRDRLNANARKNDPRVIDRLAYVAEQSFQDTRWSQIYVVAVTSDVVMPAKRITAGDFHHNGPAWSADGKSIIFSAAPPRAEYHPDFEQDGDLFIIAADGSGTPRNITGVERSVLSASRAGRGGSRDLTGVFSEGAPRFSPDGKHLAFLRSNAGEHAAAANTELMLANADGSAASCVTCALDRSINNYLWDKAGNLYFTVPDRGGVHLYRATPADRKPVALITGARGVQSFDVNGGTIAWTEMKPAAPSDVLANDVALEREVRLTALNDSLLATLQVQPYEELWYSAPDGYTLQGWIVRPPRGASRTTPLAVEMHGGPHVMWGPGEASMWLEYQSLASNGYTVFFSNPRGSDGYGFEHRKAIHRNWGHLPMGDVLAGADTVLARGLASPDKQAITGGSYAGYLTAWIVGHTNRFKAAVAQRGVFDMLSWWGTANTWRLYESEFASVPWEDPKLLWESSPIAYAANINTPLLLLHGEQDNRTGITGAEILYRMLKAQGKETQLVLYPREGHEVTRSGEPHHRVDHMNRILDWFDTHIAAPRVSTQ